MTSGPSASQMLKSFWSIYGVKYHSEKKKLKKNYKIKKLLNKIKRQKIKKIKKSKIKNQK